MYETGCFDAMTEGTVVTAADAAISISEDRFSHTLPTCSHNTHNSFEENLRLSMEEFSYNHNHPHPPTHEDAAAAATAMGIELQQQLAFNMDDSYNATNHNNTHLVDNSYSVHEMRDMDRFNHHHHHNNHEDQQQQLQQMDIQNGQQCFDYSSLPNSPYPPTPDLLNLFHLPRSISFANPTQETANYQNPIVFTGDVNPTGPDHATAASVLYDSLFHLNLPPQPPMFRDLFQSLPNGYGLQVPGSRNNGSLFGAGGDEREGSGDGFENGVLEFNTGMACIGKGRNGETKHIATDRQKRQLMNDKFNALRSLVPNPTKTDRASVVADAIKYINELLRTVNELKLLAEKKRCGRERSKRQKTEADDAAGDVESCNMKPLGHDPDQSYNGSLRSSWLQRKSKETEVDVRIIDDEVTIKLVQRKNNCLLFVSKVLDELQLDLHHVAGGHIGDFYSFLFNTKIYEGSSVYASSIANKLIEVLDRQCAAIPPTSSY
ncbi:transcription factor bHLH91-like [Corylus avellana]|uniref:transcription factor bHLH91-like n=1 Tax=Corylus avellana TaxID=13451 RepID=UPI001E20E18F|nr:transcription factor bHLH91-like [Corylus avellana]